MKALDRDSKFGYTLLEVIVVLALFAILLSIAVPSSGLIASVRENDELNRFVRDIRDMRTNAIVENRIYTLTLNEANNNYKIHRFNPEKNLSELVRIVGLENGLVLQKSGQEKASIYFKPSGAPSLGTTIHLLDRKGQNIEISISPATGSVNIKK